MAEPVGKRYAAILEIKAELPPEGGPPVPPDPDAPHPSHPIVLPGDPEWGDDLKPTHPIVIPLPPPDPPLVIWGPDDPRPVHLPCLPGMECWEEPPVGTIPVGKPCIVVPLPPTDPPEVPTLPPPGSAKALLWFGPGTVATTVWIPPFGTPKAKK